MAQSTESTYPPDEVGSRLPHIEGDEPLICVCDIPTPRQGGVVGWNAHECECGRPIL